MLIGLNGQIHAGKDTVYQRIASGVDLPNVRGMEVERIGFADKLKLSAAASLGVDQAYVDEYVDDCETVIDWVNKIKEHGVMVLHIEDQAGNYARTCRQFLQWYGTEGHRDIFGEDFWIDAALPMGFDHEDRIVCVTDCRFPNEAKRVRDLGGQVWRVLNGPLSALGHDSEQILPLDLIDVEIANHVRDDNFAHLDEQIRSALARPLFMGSPVT